MLRVLFGVTVLAVVAASCGSEDGKKKVRDADEGGAGGEASAGAPSTGGSGAELGGEAGQAPLAAGAGGMSELPSAGAPNGGMPAASGSPGEGGGAGAPEPPGPVSPTCGAGFFDAGEGGCQACVDPAEAVQIACLDYYQPELVSDAGPLWVDLTPLLGVREPLSIGSFSVTYVTPNQTESYPVEFDLALFSWRVDVSPGPDDPAEVIIEPFTTVGACGDTYESTEPVRFVRISADNYVVTCPGQT